jgi:hypothetical protein
MDAKGQAVEALKKAAVERDGRLTLPCHAAFVVAEHCGLGLAEIGAICNEERIKIVHCQLGCFQ